MWLTDFREKYGLDLNDLGVLIRRAGRRKAPPLTVSDGLLHRLEVDANFRTVPKLANLIAETCGATAAQRDALVLKAYRGTWKPTPRKRGAPPPALDLLTPALPKIPALPGSGARPVVAVDRVGRAFKRFSSVKNAVYSLNISQEVISRRCHRMVMGDEFKLLGFTLRFADEYDRMTPEERAEDVGPRAPGCTLAKSGQRGGTRVGYATTVVDLQGNVYSYATAKDAARATGVVPSTVTKHLRDGNGIGPRFLNGHRYILTGIWVNLTEGERAKLKKEEPSQSREA